MRRSCIGLDRGHSAAPTCLGLPTYGTYAATKAAIRSFARTWAGELKGRGIRVNVVSSGVIETPILESQFGSGPELEAGIGIVKSIIPLGRLSRPDAMASAISFMASDESNSITGFDLVADGGSVEI